MPVHLLNKYCIFIYNIHLTASMINYFLSIHLISKSFGLTHDKEMYYFEWIDDLKPTKF